MAASTWVSKDLMHSLGRNLPLGSVWWSHCEGGSPPSLCSSVCSPAWIAAGEACLGAATGLSQRRGRAACPVCPGRTGETILESRDPVPCASPGLGLLGLLLFLLVSSPFWKGMTFPGLPCGTVEAEDVCAWQAAAEGPAQERCVLVSSCPTDAALGLGLVSRC